MSQPAAPRAVSRVLKSSRARKRAQAGKAAGQQGCTMLEPDGEVLFQPRLFSAAASSKLLKALQEEVRWEARQVVVMGKRVWQPRLVAYMADDASLAYTYSRTTMLPLPWSPAVAAIKRQVEQAAGTTFNSCLLNLYRDGSDHMGWHADDERHYGDPSNCTIGSASFGSQRDFLLRKKADIAHKLCFSLGHGDVLVMKGAVQQHWAHSVPRRKHVDGPRINLTFRRIVCPEQPGPGPGPAAAVQPQRPASLPA